MSTLVLGVLLFLGGSTLGQAQPAPRPITVEWAWLGTVGEAFVIERCTRQGQRCFMMPVATQPLAVRRWVDHAVLHQRDYCYRLAVRLGTDQRPYSNTLCST